MNPDHVRDALFLIENRVNDMSVGIIEWNLHVIIREVIWGTLWNKIEPFRWAIVQECIDGGLKP